MLVYVVYRVGVFVDPHTERKTRQARPESGDQLTEPNYIERTHAMESGCFLCYLVLRYHSFVIGEDFLDVTYDREHVTAYSGDGRE